MINHLYIRDFAVIDELDLDFNSGLNMLTGETGAGKSIIVDAINIALGERAGSEAVRNNCDKAIIEMVIDAGGSSGALQALEEAGIAPEDGQLIISREVQKAGKSQCRINGRTVTVTTLKAVTDQLVDTHGQHEHQYLLRADRHLSFLDGWCGPEVADLRTQVSEAYGVLKGFRNELAQLRHDERERVRMLDLYQFQAEEIFNAALTPGEEEELGAERLRLANAEKLHASASTGFELLSDRGEGGCAIDTLNEAVRELQDLGILDAQLQPLIESLQSALYQVEDAARELRAYRDSVEFNPERLQSIEDRLDLIRTLKRKYGDTIEDIIAFGSDLQNKLEALANSEQRSAELESEIEKAEARAMALAEKLSKLRKSGASDFTQAVEKELETLGMPRVIFKADWERKELDGSGIDRMEFLISANPGEPPRPLAKIASGGEMSRIMLAIKSAMASAESMPTMIFDEIDVGVGGRTAEVIGQKLQSLASKSQVLCITHLPQIASRAKDHFYIEKQLMDERTVVRVRKLTDEERVDEIARMLGGAAPTETAITHAKEMLGKNG